MEEPEKINLFDLVRTNTDAVVFYDSEQKRCPSVRYLTGIPQDCIYIIKKDNKDIICPWDVNLAKQTTFLKSRIVPFTNYHCMPLEAIPALLKKLGLPENSRIEIDPETPYPVFLEYVNAMPQYEIVCSKERLHDNVKVMRMFKSEREIEIAREACKHTNSIMDKIEKAVRSGRLKTELDVAQFIEAETRKIGAERTSFETIAAGPKRSWAIHAFPTYTNAEFATQGLSILDFGIYYKGFSTDVTMTFARGPLTEKQEKMLALVQEAADECIEYYKPDVPIRQAALKAEKIFAREKMKMPHTLGHGIGLEIHEAPRVKTKLPLDLTFASEMIITLEPGLYDEEEGGVRLENDVLITEDGNELLTNSRIVRL